MGLARLTVENLRCLREVSIEPAARLNLVTGLNASGKTSLLEAIFFLGRGRTFRAARREAAVREDAPQMRVIGRLTDGRTVGVEVGHGDWVARAGGEAVRSLADLASMLPVQLMDPEIHRLVQEGPGERRRYLDWATFHVKPGFLGAWRQYQRALRQRNAALRGEATERSLQAWDEQLTAAGEMIDTLRREMVTELQGPVGAAARRLLGAEVELTYRPGHLEQQGLTAALAASRERDRRTGMTQVGPHRADLGVAVDDHRARGWVSRGQQKLLGAALVLGQGAVLAPGWGERGVLLVDDPAAELDAERLAGLMDYIRELPFQVFVTALQDDSLPGLGDARVFHVEQGTVRPVV